MPPKHYIHSELQYFNNFHIIMMMVVPIIFLIMFFLLKNKSEKTQKIIFLSLSSVSILLFVIYKIYMAVSYAGFKILDNLPLQLCNINLIIIPIALLTNSKPLYAFLYYTGIIGAFVGIVMFDTYFLGRPSFDFGVIIYFFYHAILVVFPILLVVFKKYTPRIKDILISISILLCICFCMFLFNLFLRTVCHFPTANYFYTMGMPGNPIMDMLWRIIPAAFLFYLPIMPVLFLVNYLMALPFAIKQKKARKNIQENV